MVRKAGKITGKTAGAAAGDNEHLHVSEEEAAEQEVSNEALEIYETIASMREQVGDDEQGKVVIQRRLPDGTLATLPSLPIKTFSIDLVAQKHGGGKYFVRWYKGRDYLGGDHFTIDPSVQAQPEPKPEPVSQGNGSGAEATLVVLVKGMLDELKAMRAQPVAQAKDPVDVMALMKGIAETAKAMIPPQPAAPQAASFTDQLKTATELVNLGKSIVGESGEGGASSGDLYTAAILKAIDPVIEIVKDRVQQERLGRGAPPRAALPPGTQPAATAPAAAAAPAQEVKVLPPWVLEVQRVLPIIVSRCQRNVDAANTAYFILDDLSDAAQEKLAEFAQRDDYEQQVMQFLPPQVAKNPAWTQEFLNAVRDALLGGGEEGGDEGAGNEPPTGAGDATGAPSAPASLDDAARRTIDAIPS